jgi:hypothetical protein
MIKDDRIELNERFVEVFKLLESKGVIVKNDRNGKGVGDVADKVLGNKSYGHIIRAYLNNNNKRVIDYGQAKLFARAYDVNENFLLHGLGQPFGFDSPHYSQAVEPIVGKGNIMFTTIRAFAGSTLGAGNEEDYTTFSIPGVKGSGLVAFQIQGDSMDPVIKNNDIVVCKPVENLNDLKDNEIYAVKSSGNVWVKYVQRMHNGKGRVHKLKLISANYFDNDPFEEEVNESTRIFKVVRKISTI